MKLPPLSKATEFSNKSPKEPCWSFSEICEKIGEPMHRVSGKIQFFPWFVPNLKHNGSKTRSMQSFYRRSIALRFIKEYNQSKKENQ